MQRLLFVFGVLLVSRLSAGPLAQPAKATAAETQSYNCGRHVAALVGGESQPGPLFSDGHLIFTSLEAQDMSHILIVNAGSGNFVLPLNGSGLNKIRFVLPGTDGQPSHTYFLSFVPGGVAQSRYFEYSEERPPLGHDQSDYGLTAAKRAENLEAHLNYAIQKTAQALVYALGEGRLTRQSITPQSLDECKPLANQTANLKHEIDFLEFLALGKKPQAMATNSRLPASVVAAPGTLRQRALLRPKTTSSLALRASNEWRQRVQNNNSK